MTSTQARFILLECLLFAAPIIFVHILNGERAAYLQC